MACAIIIVGSRVQCSRCGSKCPRVTEHIARKRTKLHREERAEGARPKTGPQQKGLIQF